MKTFTSLLVGCSLALAGAAFAQQPEQSPSPGAKKPGGGKNRAAQAQPGRAPGQAGPAGANAPGQQGPGAKQHGQPNPAQMPQQHQHGNAANAQQAPRTQATPAAQAPNTPGAAAARKGGHKNEPNAPAGAAASPRVNPAGQAAASAAPSAAPQMSPEAQGRGKGMKGRANAKTKPSATPSAASAPSATPATAASASATPATATSTATSPKPGASASAAAEMRPGAAPSAPATSPAASASGAVAALPTPKPDTPAATKKPAPQQVQQIKQQHQNFRAQPRPEQAPPVAFNPGYRIQGAEQWQAPQYEVFRRYRPERHDERWYRSHYRRVELIGGGWYYWDNGYWYPAWGYNPTQQYYAYDGPIYVGRRAEPPDQVIADVQAELKDMGYYKGEVDGLVGPLTRQALTEYQADSGLYQTAAIDEPTLDSLGLNS